MTQQADQQMSRTIADRTVYGVKNGLWVDVSGQNVTADKFDNGGKFDADVGYGAFGGQYELGDGYSVGAAMQYGKGTVRSDVEGIRNSVENIGFAFYGAKDFEKVRLVGELSMVSGSNDVSSKLNTKLAQEVDTTAYSVGLTAQYTGKAGPFTVVPSIGLRATRIETDAMKVGAVRIDKQEQNLFQVPVALRIGGVETTTDGWGLMPSFKLSWTPTFGDDDIKVVNVNQTVLDMNPYQAGFGIRAVKGGLTIDADLSVGGGENGKSTFGGRIGVNYAF